MTIGQPGFIRVPAIFCARVKRRAQAGGRMTEVALTMAPQPRRLFGRVDDGRGNRLWFTFGVLESERQNVRHDADLGREFEWVLSAAVIDHLDKESRVASGRLFYAPDIDA